MGRTRGTHAPSKGGCAGGWVGVENGVDGHGLARAATCCHRTRGEGSWPIMPPFWPNVCGGNKTLTRQNVMPRDGQKHSRLRRPADRRPGMSRQPIRPQGQKHAQWGCGQSACLCLATTDRMPGVSRQPIRSQGCRKPCNPISKTPRSMHLPGPVTLHRLQRIFN